MSKKKTKLCDLCKYREDYNFETDSYDGCSLDLKQPKNNTCSAFKRWQMAERHEYI